VFYYCIITTFQDPLLHHYCSITTTSLQHHYCCRKGPLIIIWRQSVCARFGVVGSRPGPVTAAALYAMMGRAAAAGGNGSYSSRSARRGAGGRGSGAGRIGEAARRDGARLRAGPQHGSGAGRGVAWRGAPAGAVRSGKARRGLRGGREGVPAARASIGHTARIRRPRRSCSSAQCATIGRRRHPAD
jgi:hypothetical protein